MASLTPKLLYIGNANTSNVYTANALANSYTIIKNINICNTSAANKSVSIHLVPSGQSPANNNKIISNVNIESNNVTFYNTSIVMPSNSQIYISQTDGNTTIAISGVEYIA